jgi:hypothetical protein
MLRAFRQIWEKVVWFVTPPEASKPESERSPLNAYDYSALAEERVVIEVKPPQKKPIGNPGSL